MKKLLILLFSILISFNSYGETGCSAKKLNDSGNINFIESTIYFQERDKLFYLPNQSKPYSGEDICTYKNASGQNYLKGQIKKGKKDGNEIIYTRNGLVSGKTKWKNGEYAQMTAYFYNDDGIKVEEKNLKEPSVYHGKQITWFDSGQINTETNFKDGKLDGKLTSWHENGQKALQYKIKDGKPYGKSTEWYESGEIYKKIIYKDDVQQWTEWYKNGQMRTESNWVDENLNGKWTEWHENGKIQHIYYLKNFSYDGKSTKFDIFGQMESWSNWKDGECISGDCPE